MCSKIRPRHISAYVGKANDPTKRFEEHIVSVNTLSRSYLANALRKYGIENFKLHIVEWFEGDDAEQRAFVGERDWIAYLREAGVHLYNNSPGGYGGKKRATLDETRQRLSKSLQQLQFKHKRTSTKKCSNERSCAYV